VNAPTWEWEEHGHWTTYGNSSEIERAHATSQAFFHFDIGRGSYTIDFRSLKQSNVATGFMRDVRRTVRKAVGTKQNATAFSIPSNPTQSAAPDFCALSSTVHAKDVKDMTEDELKGDVEKVTDWIYMDEPMAVQFGTCSLCLCDFETDGSLKVAQLSKCRGHAFHAACIVKAFQFSNKCPNCGALYGDLRGNQPQGSSSTRTLAFQTEAHSSRCVCPISLLHAQSTPCAIS
jgi:hypothetical protein